MKLSSKQKTDIAMLRHSIELVKSGGVLSWIHVSKSKAAHVKFMKQQREMLSEIFYGDCTERPSSHRGEK